MQEAVRCRVAHAVHPALRMAMRRNLTLGIGVLVAVLSSQPAYAEGYSARAFHIATDPRGIGTIDGAHAPTSGTVELGLATDYLNGPLLLTGTDRTQAMLHGRWVLEPSATLGLTSGFALYARAPFAIQDNAIDRTGDFTPTGPFPPSLGLLVPLYRDPFRDARLALRAEATLPLGDASSFRGDDAMTGRAALVYGGPVMGASGVVSLGALFGPAREVQGGAVGGVQLVGGAALRFPLGGPVAAVASVDARFGLAGAHAVTALASSGIELRAGGSTVRLLAGLQSQFTADAPNLWVGLAWSQRATIVTPPPPAMTNGIEREQTAQNARDLGTRR